MQTTLRLPSKCTEDLVCIAMCNVCFCIGDPESWQGAVDVLASNSVNLMKSIRELLTSTEIVAATSKGQFQKLRSACITSYMYTP